MVKRIGPYNQYRRDTDGKPTDRRPPQEQPVKVEVSLPQGVAFYPQALILPEHLSEQDWLALGRKLHTLHQGAQWWLGDWWRHGDGHQVYGARAKKLAQGVVPYTFGTLAVYGCVAAAYPVVREECFRALS